MAVSIMMTRLMYGCLMASLIVAAAASREDIVIRDSQLRVHSHAFFIHECSRARYNPIQLAFSRRDVRPPSLPPHIIAKGCEEAFTSSGYSKCGFIRLRIRKITCLCSVKNDSEPDSL